MTQTSLSTAGGGDFCATVTDTSLRAAFASFADAVAVEFREALWAPAPCVGLTTARGLAGCRNIVGTNDVRIGPGGAAQFRAHPDRFEIFPDRVILTEEFWAAREDPAPDATADRQVNVFRFGQRCDADRPAVDRVDHPPPFFTLPR